MNATLPLPMHAPLAPLWPYARRLGPLTLVILLHVGFFYALENGLLRQPAPITPSEVLVRFITAEPAPAPAPPQPVVKPAPPKTLPLIKKPAAKPKPAPAPVEPAPSEVASTPPAEPQPAAAEPLVSATPQEAVQASVPSAPLPPKTVTSGVEYLQAPKPEYPLLSRRRSEEGKVVLRVLINVAGRAERVEIQSSSGFSRLDEAARQAVLRAVFKPQTENGKPVMVYTHVPITFQLER